MRRFLVAAIPLALLTLFAGIALGVYKNNKASYEHFALALPGGVSVSIYQDRGGDGAYNFDSTQPPIIKTDSSNDLKLKQGVYDFVIDDPEKIYQSPVYKESIDYSTARVVIQPSYTNSKLTGLLPAARTQALAAIYSTYPELTRSYSESKDQLFGLGDWYGVLFTSTSANQDSVRTIMHKVNGNWVQAIKQPAILIGGP